MLLTEMQYYANVYVVPMKKSKTNLASIEQEIEDVLRRPIHIHMDYFFRKRYVLLAVMALMGIAIIKSDGKFLGLMRDGLSHGYSTIGAYLREEPVRIPVTVGIAKLAAVTSSK